MKRVPWKRGTRYSGYPGVEVLEVIELSDGVTVAIRNAKFFSEAGVTIPRVSWDDFVKSVKNGEFDELPKRPRSR